MGKQREAFGRARFNQLLKKKGIDTNKMHSDNEKDAAAAKKRSSAASKDLASFRKKTGINSESVNEGILNKSTYKSKLAWFKAYKELKKMRTSVAPEKQKDYRNLLNMFFHTLDDFNPKMMDRWNTKTSNKNNLGNDSVADLRFELKDILGKDAGKIMESADEIDEALTMVSRKPHPTGGHIVTLKDKDGKKVVRHLHKGKVKTLSKEETELDEKRNIKIAKSGKGERMVNKRELRTYVQMGWKEVKEGNGLWANIAAKKARGEKMRKKGAKGAPTDAQIKHAQSTSESVQPIAELTAAEKKLVNQMYDKKGNLTPLGKKVFNHNKKPGDKGYVE